MSEKKDVRNQSHRDTQRAYPQGAQEPSRRQEPARAGDPILETGPKSEIGSQGKKRGEEGNARDRSYGR